MLRNLLFCIAFFSFLPLVAHAQQKQNKDIALVKSVLLRQAEDWNRGDIDAFMQGYWKSDDLQFIGGSGVTYGWQNTLDGYKKRYPSPEAMGQLTFDIIKVKQQSKKVITLTGKYTLLRKNDAPSGHFLLIWRKIKGSWLIIADCTSAAS